MTEIEEPIVDETIVEEAIPEPTPIVGDMWQQRAQALESSIAKAESDLAQEKDKALRAAAELENYKRRKDQEVDQYKRYASERTILELLSVLDSFDRACDHLSTQDQESDAFSGFLLIQKQFHTIMEKWGVTALETIGHTFDPHAHQAVMEEVSDAPVGSVIKEFQKGYKLHDKVIRPAMVVVAKSV